MMHRERKYWRRSRSDREAASPLVGAVQPARALALAMGLLRSFCIARILPFQVLSRDLFLVFLEVRPWRTG